MRCGYLHELSREKVSIRTRSFDRVMHHLRAKLPQGSLVSIRTRSFDRVMPSPVGSVTQSAGFQSAPGLSTG